MAKKRKNSHDKGNRGERIVAKLLMEWWVPISPGCVFVRTPGSGGWGGGNKLHEYVKAGMKGSGDLMTNDPTFPFSTEVKWREAWSWTRLLEGRPSPIWDWWIQTQCAAFQDELEPMLWFKHNNEPWYVMLDVNFAMRYPMPAPVATWSDFTLRGLTHGPLKPILFAGADILALPPKPFQLEKKHE